MALQDTDLFVVQSAGDSKLYKLRLDALKTEIEGGAGVNFRGAADLNNPPGTSGIVLPAANGDLYMVESDAAAIDGGWEIQDDPQSAAKGDRIIFDGDDGTWILVTSGSSAAGTITDITTTPPLQTDGDKVHPTLAIREASETESGAVARLATDDEVAHDGAGGEEAVVTADQLRATNKDINDLKVASGVTQVTYANSDGNDAILIPDVNGDVSLDIKNATETVFGVVTIATTADLAAGTAGATAVVDASQLKDVVDNLPVNGVSALEEGGTDVVTGALQISTPDADGKTTIGVNEEVFCPYNFASLPDI